MTKEEIKKALELCIDDEDCEKCPYVDHYRCTRALQKGALALIAEQEKEIEQLKTNAEILARGVRDFNKENYGLSKKIKKLKAEIEQRKIDYDILYKKSTKRLKQAKIDVLNELKERTYRDSVYYPEVKYEHKYVHMDDIDEMIEELKK